MKNLAIIPARSGSKGLKDKNIKLLNGKPLLAYTIEAAKKSGKFDEIMVSTDSERYACIAKEWGAKVPFLRNEMLSNDTASSWDVVKNVIEEYKFFGIEFDTVALLQPTSPLRTANDIKGGYQLMSEKDANAIISVCEMDHSPVWANTLPETNSMENFVKKEFRNLPRQAIPTFFRINGAIYIVKIEYLLTNADIYDTKSYATVMSKENSVDIDSQLDFTIAEILMSNK